MELELVIVVPVLMMIVLFVVWAGRVGNAGLAVELAAEEAAVAAALSAGGLEERNRVAKALIESRPDLDYLCVGGPTHVGDGYVSEVQRDFRNTAGVARGIGLVGVAIRCETDGAVPVLRGLAPTVIHYGRGSEPFIVAGAADLPTLLTPDIAVPEGPTQEYFQGDLAPRTVLIELSLDRPVVGRTVNVVATTEQIDDEWCTRNPTDTRPNDRLPEACGGTSFGNGGCLSSPGAGGFFDYSETSFSGIIIEGQQRISFPITIIDDCIDENDEKFRVNLEVVGANVEDDHFEVIIEDNDPTPRVAFAFDHRLRNSTPMADQCGAFWTSGGGRGGHRVSEDGTTCTATIKLELRYDTDPNDPTLVGRPILAPSGRPGRFRIESIGKPLRLNTATDVPVGGCPPDFLPIVEPDPNANTPPETIEIKFLPASGEYTAQPLGGTEIVGDGIPGYNLFEPQQTPPKYPELALPRIVQQDAIDERTERFTLKLEGFSNVDPLDGDGGNAGPDGTDADGMVDGLLVATMDIEILDDEGIPLLRAELDTNVVSATIDATTLATALATHGIPVTFEVGMIRSEGVAPPFQGLPVDYEIVIHFSDDPRTTAAGDAGNELLTLATPEDSFVLPCQSQSGMFSGGTFMPGPTDVLEPVMAQVQPFIDNPGVITSIDFKLLPAPRRWPEPNEHMYIIDPAHTDFTITVTP